MPLGLHRERARGTLSSDGSFRPSVRAVRSGVWVSDRPGGRPCVGRRWRGRLGRNVHRHRVRRLGDDLCSRRGVRSQHRMCGGCRALRCPLRLRNTSHRGCPVRLHLRRSRRSRSGVRGRCIVLCGPAVQPGRWVLRGRARGYEHGQQHRNLQLRGVRLWELQHGGDRRLRLQLDLLDRLSTAQPTRWLWASRTYLPASLR